jgi:hypothetical protein
MIGESIHHDGECEQMAPHDEDKEEQLCRSQKLSSKVGETEGSK